MGRGWGRSEGWGGDGTERTGGRGVLAVAQDSIQLRSSVTLSPPPHTDTHTHTDAPLHRDPRAHIHSRVVRTRLT